MLETNECSRWDTQTTSGLTEAQAHVYDPHLLGIIMHVFCWVNMCVLMCMLSRSRLLEGIGGSIWHLVLNTFFASFDLHVNGGRPPRGNLLIVSKVA